MTRDIWIVKTKFLNVGLPKRRKPSKQYFSDEAAARRYLAKQNANEHNLKVAWLEHNGEKVV